jgi:hypothetical protein
MFETSAGQTFWEYLRGLCPDPFMELFTESGGRTIVTGRLVGGNAVPQNILGGINISGINITPMLPGFNYVVARTTPYDIPYIGTTSWASILYPITLGMLDLLLGGDFIVITDADIVDKNLGVSMNQQYTAFTCEYTANKSSSPNQARTRPSIARGSLNPFYSGGIRTYGYKEYRAMLNCLSLFDIGITGQTLEKVNQTMWISAFSTLLNYWFRNASKFNEGTVTVRGMPYARPGMYCLYLPLYDGQKVDNWRDIGIYYIDTVQDNYAIGAADTTTLTLIRGVPLPIKGANIMRLLFDWEILPPSPNITDAEV